jgi:hypothetical protein
MVRKIARTLKDAVLHDFITTTHTAPGHAMDVEKVSEFTRFVGQLCTQREIDIYRLAERLTMDPTELLRIINGRLAPRMRSSLAWRENWTPTCDFLRSWLEKSADRKICRLRPPGV